MAVCVHNMLHYNINVLDGRHVHNMLHYNNIIMSTMVSQTTGMSIVYSTVCSGVDQRKHQARDAKSMRILNARRWYHIIKSFSSRNVHNAIRISPTQWMTIYIHTKIGSDPPLWLYYPELLLPTWFNFNTTWISNHMPNKVWDEITYSFPNLNGCTVEVWEWEWINNFIPHFLVDLITYPCWN